MFERVERGFSALRLLLHPNEAERAPSGVHACGARVFGSVSGELCDLSLVGWERAVQLSGLAENSVFSDLVYAYGSGSLVGAFSNHYLESRIARTF